MESFIEYNRRMPKIVQPFFFLGMESFGTYVESLSAKLFIPFVLCSCGLFGLYTTN